MADLEDQTDRAPELSAEQVLIDDLMAQLSSLTEERDALKRQIDALQAHHPHAYHHDMMMVAKAEAKVSAQTQTISDQAAEIERLKTLVEDWADGEMEQTISNLTRALEDFAENGLRFDLNPTHNFDSAEVFFHDYIRRIDASVKERARAALSSARP